MAAVWNTQTVRERLKKEDFMRSSSMISRQKEEQKSILMGTGRRGFPAPVPPFALTSVTNSPAEDVYKGYLDGVYRGKPKMEEGDGPGPIGGKLPPGMVQPYTVNGFGAHKKSDEPEEPPDYNTSTTYRQSFKNAWDVPADIFMERVSGKGFYHMYAPRPEPSVASRSSRTSHCSSRSSNTFTHSTVTSGANYGLYGNSQYSHSRAGSHASSRRSRRRHENDAYTNSQASSVPAVLRDTMPTPVRGERRQGGLKPEMLIKDGRTPAGRMLQMFPAMADEPGMRMPIYRQVETLPTQSSHLGHVAATDVTRTLRNTNSLPPPVRAMPGLLAKDPWGPPGWR